MLDFGEEAAAGQSRVCSRARQGSRIYIVERSKAVACI
jgi:hypothetical protein